MQTWFGFNFNPQTQIFTPPRLRLFTRFFLWSYTPTHNTDTRQKEGNPPHILLLLYIQME